MNNERLVYTMNEVEVRTGLSREALRLLIGWGKLPVMMSGRHIVVRRDVLEAFLRANRGVNLAERGQVRAVRYGEL